MPKLHEHVTIPQGDGIVIEVYEASFIVRVYDKGDYDIYINDAWSFTQ